MYNNGVCVVIFLEMHVQTLIVPILHMCSQSHRYVIHLSLSMVETSTMADRQSGTKLLPGCEAVESTGKQYFK